MTDYNPQADLAVVREGLLSGQQSVGTYEALDRLSSALEAMEARFRCAPEGYIHCVQNAPDLSPLAEEMVRARTKFPGPRLLGSALAEEVGEMADSWLRADPAHCRKEALQVACVAMRIYQEGNVGHGQSIEVLKHMADLEAPARANLAQFGADIPLPGAPDA